MRATVLIAILLMTALNLSAVTPSERIYHDNITLVGPQPILLTQPDDAPRFQAAEIRALLSDTLTLSWSAPDSSPIGYLKVWTEDHSTYDALSRDQRLSARFRAASSSPEVGPLQFHSPVENDPEQWITLAVEIDFVSNRITAYYGDQQLFKLASEEFPLDGPVRFSLSASTPLKDDYVVEELTRSPRNSSRTRWDESSLKQYFDGKQISQDSPVGLWKYFDRDTSDSYSRLGGEYRLAIVEDGADGFDIIYIDGAKVNPSDWETGMLKGHLKPTLFPGTYDLTWFATDLTPACEECTASLVDGMVRGSLLRLDFPLLKSSFRLVRLP